MILTSSNMYRQNDPELLSKNGKNRTNQGHKEHLSAGTDVVYVTPTLTKEIGSFSFLLKTAQNDQTGP